MMLDSSHKGGLDGFDLTRLHAGANDLGISLRPDAAEKLARYLEAVYHANESVNLTRVPRSEAIERHVLDALTVNRAVDVSSLTSAVDVGTGAGVPGIVLAIVWPAIRMTLIDSTLKRVRFLEGVARELNLSNVEPLWTRAEQLIPARRGAYDLAVARAVAPLNVLVPWVVPFISKNGRAVLYKSAGCDAEIELAQNSIASCGCRLANTLEVSVPGANVKRLLVVIERAGAIR